MFIGHHCLSFQYHMYGEEIGFLLVRVDMGGGNKKTVFMEHGDQGNEWHKEQVDFYAPYSFWVRKKYIHICS